jgi:hypothetical protein
LGIRSQYRDKAGLDIFWLRIFWLRDENLEESDNLPDPDVQFDSAGNIKCSILVAPSGFKLIDVVLRDRSC